jgi:developmentally-regulated GTP-binding protein 1
MSKLTGTHSEISAIDFTTLTTVPGTVKVHGAPIQILDLRAEHSLPMSILLSNIVSSAGIIEGANDNRGRGRQGSSYSIKIDSHQSQATCFVVIAGMLPTW